MREQPRDLEAERVVLGAILVDSDVAYPRARLFIDSRTMFYNPRHRLVWDAIAWCVGEGVEANPMEVTHRLKSAGEYEKAGGGDGLLALQQERQAIPSLVSNAAKRVRDYAMLRGAIDRARELLAGLYDSAAENSALEREIERFEVGMSRVLSPMRRAQGRCNGHESVADTFRRIRDRLERVKRGETVRPSTITTTFDVLDVFSRVPAGLPTYVLGRPGDGKSALVRQMFTEYRRLGLQPYGQWNEDTNDHFAIRELADVSGISSRQIWDILDGLGSWDAAVSLEVLIGHCDRITPDAENGHGGYWDDSGGLSAEQACARSREAVRNGARVVMGDILSKIIGPGNLAKKNEKVEHIALTFAANAKELNVPYIWTHHLHRMEGDQLPTMDNAKDSGQIEQDARLMLAVWRSKNDSRNPEPHPGKIGVLKANHGGTGWVDAIYEPARTKWRGPTPIEAHRFEIPTWQTVIIDRSAGKQTVRREHGFSDPF